MHDLTKEKQTYDFSPVGTIIVEMVSEKERPIDLIIRYINKAACELALLSAEDVLDVSFYSQRVEATRKWLDTVSEILVHGKKRSFFHKDSVTGQYLRFECFYHGSKLVRCFVYPSEQKNLVSFGADEMAGASLDDRPMTETEKIFSSIARQYAVYDSETYNLTHENDFICLSELRSHEIIKIIGSDLSKMNTDIAGQKCYKVLQDRERPCPHCSNKLLKKNHYHIWEYHDKATGREYLHKNKLVEYDNRLVRMDISQDVSDSERKSVLLTETLSGMSVWNEINRILSDDIPFDAALHEVMDELGGFFAAKSGYVFLMGQRTYRLSWSVDDEYSFPSWFENPTRAAIEEWTTLLKDKSHIFIPDTKDDAIPEVMRAAWVERGVDSSYNTPIFIDENLVGALCLNDVSANASQIFIIEMVARSLGHAFHREELQEYSQRLRFTDSLTGYLNFDGFKQKAEEYLRENPNEKYAFWYCDIRRFKYLNDIFGYEVGDEFLRYWMKLTEKQVGGRGVFGRISADNIVVLSAYKTKEDIENNFTEIVDALSHFDGLKGKNFKSEIMAGVYVLEKADVYECDINKILDRANIAQKSVKELSGNRLAFYDEDMRGKQLRELEISQHLEEGIKNGEFYLNFQPQYNNRTGEIVGAEALVRWQHPEFGFVSPGEFIPLLEQVGLVTDLDFYVWEETCKFIRFLLDNKDTFSFVPLSVNISRVDLYLPDLSERIMALVNRYNLEPSMLKLEITESAYMDGSDILIKTVNEFKEAGFTVEMDDFGSGYSSLNILKDVRVDVLKLDMQFLAVGYNSQRGSTIISSVVQMAHEIGLPAIAEGVETEEQAKYLSSIECNIMQGYYFAKPMSMAAFMNLLRTAKVGKFGN